MQPPRDDLAPPKDDPYTLEDLRQFDGRDESKPIYVSVKGTVFDVTRKAEVYGLGRSYNVFAGKDPSKGMGMSSLKEEDALPDYSGLNEADRGVLDDWYNFFTLRYDIVGKVVDHPQVLAPLDEANVAASAKDKEKESAPPTSSA
ncbi:unnamed protein product [Mycena citricolor]|uniref:Cytochrome b5 heme-binding domain-containing protein n=1 Tax=Mycena citricolor TaxID=2018698 RepID=A0AAD2Q712_9AGAR|nr:unnamed protein product [Mycena citricolor]